jgi:serine phosphatase RsbU (regulator of sigma subunit)
LTPEIDEWVKLATITLQPGEALVLYTDGITEAENEQDEPYGLDRLCAMSALTGTNWQRRSKLTPYLKND